ncbi:hypothetical protein [Mycobacterium sp. SP-6446]|uniref:hypothetical protein n=1 Tax=Mycobacterium sp. SP-6446 TaxID=1834162 RepID=UPI001115667B|nr:hypothetical protein [Mycobacterium sp. SP-6446]
MTERERGPDRVYAGLPEERGLAAVVEATADGSGPRPPGGDQQAGTNELVAAVEAIFARSRGEVRAK